LFEAVLSGLMNVKPVFTQVFGRFFSMNPVYNVYPNFLKPGFELILGRFSDSVSSREQV
jgi:hypothetical protein